MSATGRRQVITTAIAAPAMADTSTSNLEVTATVPTACFVETTTVAFGNLNIDGSPTDGAGGIDVTCTSGTAWTAVAAAGAGEDATVGGRKMTRVSGLGEVLNYNLYIDTGRSVIWQDDPGDGEGQDEPPLYTGIGTGSAQIFSVYGRVPGGQTVPPGDYADTVIVTLHH